MAGGENEDGGILGTPNISWENTFIMQVPFIIIFLLLCIFHWKQVSDFRIDPKVSMYSILCFFMVAGSMFALCLQQQKFGGINEAMHFCKISGIFVWIFSIGCRTPLYICYINRTRAVCENIFFTQQRYMKMFLYTSIPVSIAICTMVVVNCQWHSNHENSNIVCTYDREECWEAYFFGAFDFFMNMTCVGLFILPLTKARKIVQSSLKAQVLKNIIRKNLFLVLVETISAESQFLMIVLTRGFPVILHVGVTRLIMGFCIINLFKYQPLNLCKSKEQLLAEQMQRALALEKEFGTPGALPLGMPLESISLQSPAVSMQYSPPSFGGMQMTSHFSKFNLPQMGFSNSPPVLPDSSRRLSQIVTADPVLGYYVGDLFDDDEDGEEVARRMTKTAVDLRGFPENIILHDLNFLLSSKQQSLRQPIVRVSSETRVDTLRSFSDEEFIDTFPEDLAGGSFCVDDDQGAEVEMVNLNSKSLSSSLGRRSTYSEHYFNFLEIDVNSDVSLAI